MAVAALACKAAIAVLLVAAGAAKLADLAGFVGAARLFLPARTNQAPVRAVAAGIALTEIAAGAWSLSSPQTRWLNLAVLALCCGFVAVSAIGYVRHPGRACRCFGALTGRAFTRAAIGRATARKARASSRSRPTGPRVNSVDPVPSAITACARIWRRCMRAVGLARRASTRRYASSTRSGVGGPERR
ncbi:MAG TPA: MauE/DoxX family redox-associated membrane protein, partial [Streptosporangiaceae bacterium]